MNLLESIQIQKKQADAKKKSTQVVMGSCPEELGRNCISSKRLFISDFLLGQGNQAESLTPGW